MLAKYTEALRPSPQRARAQAHLASPHFTKAGPCTGKQITTHFPAGAGTAAAAPEVGLYTPTSAGRDAKLSRTGSRPWPRRAHDTDPRFRSTAGLSWASRVWEGGSPANRGKRQQRPQLGAARLLPPAALCSHSAGRCQGTPPRAPLPEGDDDANVLPKPAKQRRGDEGTGPLEPAASAPPPLPSPNSAWHVGPESRRKQKPVFLSTNLPLLSPPSDVSNDTEAKYTACYRFLNFVASEC